jgi:uncharacterized protein (TIGR02246 family)
MPTVSSRAATTPASIEERIERLESMEAARRLMARYARACDAQDLDGIVELFAPDCELEIPGRTWRGRDEVREFFRRAWADDPSRKSHFITNVECRPREAGSVAVDAYFLYTASGDRSSVIGWGCYADVVDTTAPDPVFARKAMTVTRAADVRDGWAG